MTTQIYLHEVKVVCDHCRILIRRYDKEADPVLVRMCKVLSDGYVDCLRDLHACPDCKAKGKLGYSR